MEAATAAATDPAAGGDDMAGIEDPPQAGAPDPAGSGDDGQQGESAQPEQQGDQESTAGNYAVLAAPAEEGPYAVVGTFDADGQRSARKAALDSSDELKAQAASEDSTLFLSAVPLSSWHPHPVGYVKPEPKFTV